MSCLHCVQGKVSPGLRILESGAISLLRDIEGKASELLHTVTAQPHKCIVMDELAILVTQPQPHATMARTDCIIWTLPRETFQKVAALSQATQGLTASCGPLRTTSESLKLQQHSSLTRMPSLSKANASIGFPVLFYVARTR
jgi:CRP-like cAMP-binding protein